MLKCEIYQDKKGEYRWRVKAKNGRVIATSGEGLSRKRYAKSTTKALFKDTVTFVEPKPKKKKK